MINDSHNNRGQQVPQSIISMTEYPEIWWYIQLWSKDLRTEVVCVIPSPMLLSDWVLADCVMPIHTGEHRSYSIQETLSEVYQKYLL